MSVKNEALLRDWFEEVWNDKNAAAIDERMAEDTIAHGMGPNGGDLVGREAFKAMHALYCGAFPDIKMTLDPVFATDDMAACHFICKGTHRGDHLGVAPTGKAVTIRAMTIAKFRDGKIVEGWNCVDLLPTFQEIGVVVPASTG